MLDFTLSTYKAYLEAIKVSYDKILCFREFIPLTEKPVRFCLIRHDVDRKPGHALKMAQLEASIGLRSTYYFRAKPNTFIPKIIQEIAALGHEIGYHYESLSDTNGNIERALADFEKNLSKFRELVPVDTISMHGRPFKPFDNRDLWRQGDNHLLLKKKFGIAGEVYLDIDYKDIAYIGDTGRNWYNSVANARDHVASDVSVEFRSGAQLLKYLQEKHHEKLCFQIHPERWSDEKLDWAIQLLQDGAINQVKYLLKLLR